LQALAEQSRIVRLPLNKIGAINKINKAFSQLEQTYEREPNPDEIADLLEISEGEVKESLVIQAAMYPWMLLLFRAKKPYV